MAKARTKAQSFGEYTVITSLVVLAIAAMTYFIQRGFASRINDGRRYMLDTLDADIRDVHFMRGGKPYPAMRTEYEPYYAHKIADTKSTPVTNIFINGKADMYQYDAESYTAINAVAVEKPAGDY